MRINCLKGNPSLDFYIHMGGKVIGEFENSILGPGVMEEIIIYDQKQQKRRYNKYYGYMDKIKY